MLRLFSIVSQIVLVLVFMIVIAGSVVRATGSGMGCPDWPKCFGRLIPPTSVDQVTWASGKSFDEGEMIVYNDALYTANEDLTAGDEFDISNWDKYTKHDYAIYNPMHTWIEFMNRLLAPTSGFPAMIMLGLSVLLWLKQKRRDLFWLSFGVVFFMGVEAWLGKVVVDGNLIPGHISMHMGGTFIIIALLQRNIYLSKPDRKPVLTGHKFRWATIGLLALLLLQTFLGTQVREGVDELLGAGVDRGILIGELDVWFYIHRSFSILITLLVGYMVWRNWKEYKMTLGWILAILILVTIIVGIVLSYASIPAFFQPIHLWLTVLTFMTLVGILGRTKVSR